MYYKETDVYNTPTTLSVLIFELFLTFIELFILLFLGLINKIFKIYTVF